MAGYWRSGRANPSQGNLDSRKSFLRITRHLSLAVRDSQTLVVAGNQRTRVLTDGIGGAVPETLRYNAVKERT